jgi:hypothetical protein
MPFLGKALYNLFFLQGLEGYAHYSALSDRELFLILQKFDFHFDKETFGYFGADLESPEELFELLTVDKEKHEEIYLAIFELWKRVFPEKKSISLFCDELDHLIHEYDMNHLVYDELLQEKIFLLQNILDANVDSGEKPKRIFAAISDYLAHDLESFIYDYIYEQIELEKDTLASEVLDGFYPYIHEKLWFDYLRLRLFFHAPSDELAIFLSHFVESLISKPDLPLLYEFLQFLLDKNCIQLFQRVFQFVASRIEKNRDLEQMILIAVRFYKLSENFQYSNYLEEGLKEVKAFPQDKKFSDTNPWYLKVLQV